MATFQDFIYDLQNMGVADVLLPFVLVFTVMFAILQKTKVLGEKGKRFNVIVAVVIGFAVVMPHILTPSPNDAVSIMNKAFPSVSIFVIAILSIFLLLGLFGPTPKWTKGAGGWAVIVAFLIVAGIFLYAAGYGWNDLPDWLNFLEDPGTVYLIVIVAVFVIIIGYVTSTDDEGKDGTLKKAREGLGELFGAGGKD
jgi:hypothetical protein